MMGLIAAHVMTRMLGMLLGAQALLSVFWYSALAGERDLCSQSGLAQSEKLVT